MPIDQLIDIIQGTRPWPGSKEAAEAAFVDALGDRYPNAALASVKLRAPQMSGEGSVPFAAYIHPENPDSSAYAGMSIAIFPGSADNRRCLVTFVVGTAGLSPDDEILGRPGHARKVQALCSWINADFGKGQFIAWAKQDPARIDEAIPDNVTRAFDAFAPAFAKYGRVIYGLFVPTDDVAATREVVKPFFDLMFDERNQSPRQPAQADASAIRSKWFAHLMPDVSEEDITQLLRSRRFVVIQGPPGTGKTRMATRLRDGAYGGNGTTIQFHPNTTYENFVGGLAPVRAEGSLGFAFAPQRGFLMQAALHALETPDRAYLLHIDEINRADLSKILGEAIYLFEPKDASREIRLPYDFGAPFADHLQLPPNLHVLGTMNSADRSLAIVDVAVRRRFAFMKLWPQSRVVEEHGNAIMQDAFQRIATIFIEHASGDAFELIPGHSYFMQDDPADDTGAARQLRTTLVPLLEEYVSQGYVGGFSEPIRGYLQWIDSL